MKVLLALLVITSLYGKNLEIVSKNTSGNNEEYIVNVEYTVGDNDSKSSLRQYAIVDAKNVVAEDIGTFTISNIVNNTNISGSNVNVMTSKSEMLSPLISKTTLLDENINNGTYFSRVKVIVNIEDKNKLLQQIKETFDNKANTFNVKDIPITIKNYSVENYNDIENDLNKKQNTKNNKNLFDSVNKYNRVLSLNEIKDDIKMFTRYMGSEQLGNITRYTLKTTIIIDPVLLNSYINNTFTEDCVEKNPWFTSIDSSYYGKNNNTIYSVNSTKTGSRYGYVKSNCERTLVQANIKVGKDTITIPIVGSDLMSTITLITEIDVFNNDTSHNIKLACDNSKKYVQNYNDELKLISINDKSRELKLSLLNIKYSELPKKQQRINQSCMFSDEELLKSFTITLQ